MAVQKITSPGWLSLLTRFKGRKPISRHGRFAGNDRFLQPQALESQFRAVFPVRRFISLAVCWFLVASVSAADDVPASPASHTERNIEGWTVKIDDRLLSTEHASLGERGLKILAKRLDDIRSVVADTKLQRLQQVTIWIDLTHGELKSAQYHPDSQWLKDHGYSEQLAKAVHIPDARYFFDSRHQNQQPWALLHELAHAYHDQILDFENPKIKTAWQRFKDSGRYNLVDHIDGKPRPHYALTNQMEFFAEMSESYFGMNDFFPFNRAELQKEEPEIYQLLREIWGPVP